MTGNAYEYGDILRFQTNVPVEVALLFAEGVPVEGRFGDQMLHTLTGGRKSYPPPILAQKNVEFGPLPNAVKCAETLIFLHDQDHVGIPVEHGTRTPLDTAQGRRPRKALADFDVSICQPRQRGMCMHVLSLPSNYVPVPGDPASAGAAAGEEV